LGGVENDLDVRLGLSLDNFVFQPKSPASFGSGAFWFYNGVLYVEVKVELVRMRAQADGIRIITLTIMLTIISKHHH
jgi:hypothetical protein